MSNNDSSCFDPWGDPDTRLWLNNFLFWFMGVVYCAVGVLGLIGNTIAIIVFTRKDMVR